MQVIASAGLRAGAFIHRFGSSLNAHLYLRRMVSDGVFDASTMGGIVVRTGACVRPPARVAQDVALRIATVPAQRPRCTPSPWPKCSRRAAMAPSPARQYAGAGRKKKKRARGPFLQAWC
jgi:hypothetical protein